MPFIYKNNPPIYLLMYSTDFLKLFAQQPSPHFVISTHKFCDGDGLGAGLALYYALKKIKLNASFYTLELIHPKYKFLNKDNIIQVFDKEKIKYNIADRTSGLNNKIVALQIFGNRPSCLSTFYSDKKTTQYVDG